MFKKHFKTFSYWTSVITIGIILGLSIQFVKAWTEPPTQAPNGDVGAPINTGNNTQIKSGALEIKGVFQSRARGIFVSDYDATAVNGYGLQVASYTANKPASLAITAIDSTLYHTFLTTNDQTGDFAIGMNKDGNDYKNNNPLLTIERSSGMISSSGGMQASSVIEKKYLYFTMYCMNNVGCSNMKCGWTESGSDGGKPWKINGSCGNPVAYSTVWPNTTTYNFKRNAADVVKEYCPTLTNDIKSIANGTAIFHAESDVETCDNVATVDAKKITVKYKVYKKLSTNDWE